MNSLPASWKFLKSAMSKLHIRQILISVCLGYIADFFNYNWFYEVGMSENGVYPNEIAI